MNPTAQTINLQVTIPEDYATLRLDQALARLLPDYSRSRLQSFIRQQQVLVDGKPGRPRDKVHGGEKIAIAATLLPEEDWSPEAIDLTVLYEDEEILVINKPVGLVIHPAVGNRQGTLLNALIHHHPPLATLPRAGIVHRLDKDTSGVLVIAKTLSAHTHLVKQMQQREIKREYAALVQGVMTAGGTVRSPMGRHPTIRTRMAVVASGKEAVTHYRVLERFRAHTLVKVILETGRTHQIRVHMAHIYYPLVGDQTYGGRLKIPAGIKDSLWQRLKAFKHQALHAQHLTLQHPKTHDTMAFEAPLPEEMQGLLAGLRADNRGETS